MTHPQSPASPLPEAAEPVQPMDDDELQDFCISLSFDQDDYTVDVIRNVERRMLGQPLFQCSVMSNTEMDAAPPSPVAQAPAQAGEVANDFAAGWNINLCDTRPSEVASPTLADHSIVRAALATQPLAAPVQQEAEATAAGAVAVLREFDRKLAEVHGTMEDAHAYVYGWVRADWEAALAAVARPGFEDWFGPNESLMNTHRRQGWNAAIQSGHATPPAHPVLAPVVREPLTEDALRAEWMKTFAAPKKRTFVREADGRYANRFTEKDWQLYLANAIQATTGEQSHG